MVKETVEQIITMMSQAGLSDEEYQKVFDLAKQAEEQTHDAFLQYMLGLCYQVGRGTIINQKKAFDYYLKSANQGNAQSMYTVGLCYENGMGIEEDLNEACDWYYKANELGHVDAMFQLGWLYMFATEDNEEAFNYGVECMRAAAENDHPQAIEIMKELEKAGH